ncbi:MAG: acyltransferase [Sandaracinus sp.]
MSEARDETARAETPRDETPRAPAGAPPPKPGFFGLDLLDNRYPALHGLRVIAILSVLQIHVTWDYTTLHRIGLDQSFVDRSLATFFGMDCFFVLSGFLIGSILLRSIATSGTQQIRRFYLRRIFRTFPSYYLVLTALVLMFPLSAAQRSHLAYEYTYLTNFVPLARRSVVMIWGWSLSLEEQFYLAVPLLFVALRRMRSDAVRLAFLGALSIGALFVRLYIYSTREEWVGTELHGAVYFRTWTRFDPLLVGVMLAVIEARWGPRIATWLERPAHRAMLAVPATGCVWLLLFPELFGEEHEQLHNMFRWGTITSVMYLALVPMLLHGTGAIARFLSAPIWRRLATLGYGVYLVHIPILDHVLVPIGARMAERGVPPAAIWVLTFAGVIVLSFAAGYVLHVLVEKPSLRIRERLAA